MPVGLLIRNGANELALTSDGYVYGYIGTATPATIVQPATSVPATGTANEGYSEYNIFWPGEIIAAIPIGQSAAAACSILDTTRDGGLWTIRVRNGDGLSENSIGFRGEAYTTVHVWGTPTVDPGWGLLIKAPDGSLRADLSRKPFAISQRITWATGEVSKSMSVPNPLIVSASIGGRLANPSYPSAGVGEIYRILWWWDTSTGTLQRTTSLRQKYNGEDGPSTSTALPPLMAIVTSANNV